ncbi:unnamed protein product [Rotaria socialis]|uniref:Uncharacterized protein n=1 Tax=Rotaria socialis TaxID=392032 RepID=A0A817YIS9_9BILA|nr:unnamed protein product [Rotaria socialis]CAF3379148.1 unnamed protein product [Rotaria socialis]CAF3386357.1 unnamed protein product [Rotaria socialis]CAF3618468.1 unnamed protein product [Rotaria socialis]CAF4489025.1 unnamed protein product [Rotaria socialis]
MPATLGLIPSQQESFEHHEELSKLLNETDVFYVPFQSHFQHNLDLSDLTKRFDEDILSKHLVVTFRDIGYSLYLDSVQSIPDQNDETKTRISGKMIVDGICIQFLGCFDCNNKIPNPSEIQQINGVGKVQLDEDYYKELSTTQVYTDEKSIESMGHIETMGSTERSIIKTKTRSRTISENILGKNHNNNNLKSPPSSLSNSRSHMHSPSRMPYTRRSPRTINHPSKAQYQASSPINIESPSVSRSSGFHSSVISPSSSVTSSFNENPLDMYQQHHVPLFYPSNNISSSLNNPTTIPIQIPSSNKTIPPASFSHLSGIFPTIQSHSLPNYFLPQANFAYLIANSNQNPTPPFHIITPLNHPSLQYPNAHFSTLSHSQANSINENLTSLHIKRPDNEEHKQAQVMDTNKQSEEQLPFKKRRYTGQSSSVYSPMDTNHDDDDASDESMKK